MSNYKYYISNIEVFPKNSGGQLFQYQPKNDAGLQYDLVAQNEFIFDYDQSGFNFKTQEETNLCSELDFKITRRCGSTWSIFWEGVFSIVEGKFDDDNCTYSITPRIKTFMVDDLEINILDEPTRVVQSGVYGVSIGGAQSNPNYRNYRNARYFNNLVLYVAQRSNQRINSLVSDFFQINPVNVSSNCLPGVPNYFTNMVFCALSDVQEPVPSNFATREYVTFRELMDDLNVLFDVHWFIDSNYNLRIEHSTFFEGVQGLDLTQTKYSNYVAGKNKYSFDLRDYPKKEVWSIADHQRKATLSYSGISNVGKRTSEKRKSTSRIRTQFGRNLTNDGVYLFATDGGSNFGYLSISAGRYDHTTGTILFFPTSIPFSVIYNIILEYEWLVLKIHSYNRPSLYAIYETSKKELVQSAGGVVLSSIKATKLYEKISFPLCCEDSFNPIDQIKTSHGLGYVDDASFDQKTSLLTVGLKYKSDNCDTFNPLSISGMQLWLKYQTGITSTASQVDQWDDQSGNARHATATGSNRPLWAGPGNQIEFYSQSAGAHKFLTTPAFQMFPNKRGTVFILVHSGSAVSASGGANMLSTNGGNNWDLSLSTPKPVSPNAMGSRFKAFAGAISGPQGLGPTSGPPVPGSKDFGIYYPQHGQLVDLNGGGNFDGGLFVIRRVSDTNIYTKQDGVFAANNPLVIANTQPVSSPLIIGGNTIYGPDLNGQVQIMEVIIYDRALTDVEIELVEFYFVKTGYYRNTSYIQ